MSWLFIDEHVGNTMKYRVYLCLHCVYYIISGWWLGHPSEKYESQLG